MSEIAQTSEMMPLPSRSELKTLCFSLSKGELWERLANWEEHGSDGAHKVSQALYVSSIKEALEKNHPYTKKSKPVKNFEALQREYVYLMDYEEEDGFFGNRKTRPFRVKIQNAIASGIKKWFPHFLTQALRECAVKQHARGNSTTNVVKYILSPVCEPESPFFYLNDANSFLEKHIIEWLTPRIAYLKPGSSAFPKKYLDLWKAERDVYLTEITEIALTETVEQVQALSDLYSRLDDAFNNAVTDRGKAQISSSMVKVMSGIYTLTRDPSLKQPALKSEKEQRDANNN